MWGTRADRRAGKNQRVAKLLGVRLEYFERG
jgi:hypothetical protein